MRRFLIILMCVSCLPLAAASTALGFNELQAKWEAATYAHNKWGGNAAWYVEHPCTGPFENVKGKTQWACYGKMSEGTQNGKFFQINVDPFGTLTFERLCSSKCPGSP